MYFDAGAVDNCIAELGSGPSVSEGRSDVYGTLAVALMRKGDLEKALSVASEGGLRSRRTQDRGPVLPELRE